MSTTLEEIQAFQELAKARRENFHRMFSGSTLRYGPYAAYKLKKKLSASKKDLRENTQSLAKAALSKTIAPLYNQAEEFIRTCADVEEIREIVEIITSSVISELVTEITPVLGAVSSGTKTIMAAQAVVSDARALYSSHNATGSFLPGDPVAAAEAVERIIQRDLATDSLDLSRHSTSTGLKIAGIFADAGTLTNATVGAANALAQLGLELYKLGRDVREMEAGNRLLSSPYTLDTSVFSECPILGCYLITCSDTSTLANFFLSDIGMPGWMDRVEEMKRHKMDPLIKVASERIEKSRIKLEGLRSNKGIYINPGLIAQIKYKAISRFIPQKMASRIRHP